MCIRDRIGITLIDNSSKKLKEYIHKYDGGIVEFVKHINNKKPILVNKNEKEVFKRPIYVTSSKNNVIEYKKLVDEEGIISILITFDSNDKPKSIIAYGIKKNFLFNSYRNYKLSFDSIGNLTNYLFEDPSFYLLSNGSGVPVIGNAGASSSSISSLLATANWSFRGK